LTADSFDNRVTAICRASNYHIWALRHTRRLLPDGVARTQACSIVTTLLDYCNSLMYSLIQPKLSKASESAKLFITCCVTSSKTHTPHSSAYTTLENCEVAITQLFVLFRNITPLPQIHNIPKKFLQLWLLTTTNTKKVHKSES